MHATRREVREVFGLLLIFIALVVVMLFTIMEDQRTLQDYRREVTAEINSDHLARKTDSEEFHHRLDKLDARKDPVFGDWVTHGELMRSCYAGGKTGEKN